jgi:hypothetical protein
MPTWHRYLRMSLSPISHSAPWHSGQVKREGPQADRLCPYRHAPERRSPSRFLCLRVSPAYPRQLPPTPPVCWPRFCRRQAAVRGPRSRWSKSPARCRGSGVRPDSERPGSTRRERLPAHRKVAGRRSRNRTERIRLTPGQARTSNAGFVEHLVKPITLPELRAAIARATNGMAQRHS